ncbi:phage tail tape measure protein [Paraburkholderia acidipaludis]|uniref:membrane protein n=1 Tax=Paraburkholderia acidipaludis TaxID=660537 RepID=UPI000480C19F|nr:membrane protein [Paraburkholderia acidipaludis]
MDNALKLRVMFDAIDNLTKPLKNILAGNKGLAGSLKETRRELAEMGKTQKTVGEFREVRKGLAATATQLNAARGRVGELAASMRSTSNPSRQMAAGFEKAKQAAARLTTEHERQSTRVRELRDQLAAAGVNTRNLSQHERDLRGNIAATTATMKDQMAKLEAIGDREKRVAAARRSMEKMQGVAAGMAVGGYAARSTGTHIFGDLRESLDESKEFEREAMRIKALGLGDHASADAVKYARAMKQYGVATTDNVLMMRDALSIFADEHHAQMVMPTLSKMKFANDSMYGAEDAHANEEKFMNMLKVIELRGGTKNEATFKDEANMVQKVITATGGRVGGDQWRDFIQTGGVAAKQMRKDAFYYQMEPLIQEMGGHAVGTGLMSAYSNAYQGKTTVRAAKQMMALGLLDPKMVEYTKIGTIRQVKPGALAGGDQLKASPLEWLEKVLLPKLAAKGITDPDKVKDMISTIFTNRTAANLFTTMYMQRDQIHKNERLNAGADGIDAAAAKGEQLTQGREIAALTQLRDLKLEIGEKISPLYNAALQATAAATSKVVGFMREHGTAAKVMLTALAALAAILVVIGTLTIALAGILGPMAVVKFSMQTLGMQGGLLARGLGLGASAFRMFGTAAMFAGRAMLMNPIGLAITAAVAVIAGGAYLIYTYWDQIRAGASWAWDGIRGAFAGGMAWFAALPAQFAEFGTHLISGLVNGITNGLGTVKDAIVNVASSTVGWFKEKLGIHSPSRVFAELGGFVAQGAAIGMEGEQGRVARAAVAMATVATTAFGAPAFATGASAATVPLVRPTVPIDSRPPVVASPAGRAAGASGAAAPIINIYPQAGADPQAIARAVAAELDRRERAQRSRRVSSLSDH